MRGVCRAPLSPLAHEDEPPALWSSPPRCATPAGMDAATLFGLFAVSFMLLCYMMEDRAPYWTLLFALGCLMGSAYGFLQGAWPFGLVELAWFVVALRKWVALRRSATRDSEPLA